MKKANLVKLLTILGLILVVALQFIDVPAILSQEPSGDVSVQVSHRTTFTYQGHLTDNNRPANSDYDFRFILYNAEIGGQQVGDILFKDNVIVVDGVFTVMLDFGSVFDGTEYFLEIAVKPSGSSNDYTTLSPRQAVTTVPYAIFARESELAGQAEQAEFAREAELAQEAERLITGENGLIKAAVAVSCEGPDNTFIAYSLNNTGNPITINYRPGSSQSPDACEIDFGFSLENRFWIMQDIAPLLNANPRCHMYGTALGPPNKNSLACGRFNVDRNGWTSQFFVIVY